MSTKSSKTKKCQKSLKISSYYYTTLYIIDPSILSTQKCIHVHKKKKHIIVKFIHLIKYVVG